jgi:hypothetical protein
MSEAGYVEEPNLEWLSGHGSATPGFTGLGWTYRTGDEMSEFDRPLEDPFVERLLIRAIISVQGVKQCRDDTVLLVNGIPLVIAEYKSYISSDKDWTEAVHQLNRYQRQAPLMLTPNVFCVAADEEAIR